MHGHCQCRAEVVIIATASRCYKVQLFPVFNGAKSLFAHLNKQLAVIANRRLLKDLPTMKVQHLFAVMNNVDCR